MRKIDTSQGNCRVSFWDMTIPELIKAGKGFWVVFFLLAICQAPLVLIALSAQEGYRLVLAIYVFFTFVPAKIIAVFLK